MRLLLLIFIMLAGSLFAGERTAYPLWDGSESVAEYAKKVNLPPTKTLDLGGGVKMELVLIPAGKFIMGTPEPPTVDEGGFQRKIVTAQACLVVSGAALLVMLAVVILRAIRKKRRPQLSLGRLLAVTVATGGCVLSGLHWRQSANGLQVARLEYTAAKARFKSANDNEKPAHPVTLTQPFYMGKYDVTQEQYQAVIGSNPSHFIGKDNPVEPVSWDDAQAFCKQLSEKSGQTIRLPTEAEWEYACRAGTVTTYHSGDREGDLGEVAWYSANSKNATYPVGQKDPNAFGLYDMHGNVWQWCRDWFADDYYAASPIENPQSSTEGKWHVLRGGTCNRGPYFSRSANRGKSSWNVRRDPIGFRIVADCH